jgi:orotate phosphoribosyltransferase
MDPMRAARLANATAQKLPRDLRQQIQKVVSRDGRRDHRP